MRLSGYLSRQPPNSHIRFWMTLLNILLISPFIFYVWGFKIFLSPAASRTKTLVGRTRLNRLMNKALFFITAGGWSTGSLIRGRCCIRLTTPVWLGPGGRLWSDPVTRTGMPLHLALRWYQTNRPFQNFARHIKEGFPDTILLWVVIFPWIITKWCCNPDYVDFCYPWARHAGSL